MSSHPTAAAAPSPKSEPAKASDSSGGEALGTLGLFPDVWVLAMLVSLGLSVGLAKGSRGSAVGLDGAIDFIDRASSVAAQFAAVSTFFLAVHLGFSVARSGNRRWLAIPAALLGLTVAALLVSAQQIALAQESLLYAVFASALTTTLLAFCLQAKYRLARALLLICAGSLALELVLPFELGSVAEQGAMTLSFLGGATLALASVAGLVHAARARGLTLALVLAAGGGTMLLSRYEATGEEQVPIVIVGRSLRALSEGSFAPSEPTLFLIGALAFVLCASIARRLFKKAFTPADLPLLGLLALLILVGPSPLSLSAVVVTALGFVALASHTEEPPAPT